MSSGSTDRRRGLPRKVKMRHDTHFVEDLTVRQEEPIGRMVALAQIEPDPNQPRDLMGDLNDLTASIREKGVLEPILVRPNPERDSGSDARPYRIVSGERRFQAARAAGLIEVPVIEMDVGEDEALEIALVENLQRKDLTPFEEGEGYRSLADRHGYTHEQIAEAVGKSRTVITESLALLQMPPRARDAAVGLGLTSKSVLLEVIKGGKNEAEMIDLLEKVADQGWGRDDLRAAARSRKAAHAGRRTGRQKPFTFNFRSPDKSFKLSLSFRRSTVDREDLIAALEEILKQVRRSEGGK